MGPSVTEGGPEGDRDASQDPASTNSPPQPDDGLVRQEISNEVTRLYKRHFGKGPLGCRTYVQHDLVAVVLSGGYTAGEQTLFEGGRWYEVRQARQLWQDSMKLRFIDVIQEQTGRHVKAFMSANHQDPDLAVELFVLDSEASPEVPG